MTSPRTARAVLELGADFVLVGRTAILHPDWADAARDPDFEPVALPVSEAFLAERGVGARFLRYLHTFDGFVRREEVEA